MFEVIIIIFIVSYYGYICRWLTRSILCNTVG